MREENIKTKLEELVSNGSDMGETALKLAKIKATRKAINISSLFIFRATLSLIAVFAILFCSAAAALWLGNLFHSLIAGLLIIGGFYILLFILLLLLKNKLLLPFLRNRIVRKIYE